MATPLATASNLTELNAVSAANLRASVETDWDGAVSASPYTLKEVYEIIRWEADAKAANTVTYSDPAGSTPSAVANLYPFGYPYAIA